MAMIVWMAKTSSWNYAADLDYDAGRRMLKPVPQIGLRRTNESQSDSNIKDLMQDVLGRLGL